MLSIFASAVKAHGGNRSTKGRAFLAFGICMASLLPSDLFGDETRETRRPHPWLKDVPPALSRLVDVGHVEILEDQAAVEAARRSALTVFSFSFTYRMRFRMSELPKDNNGKVRTQISVNFFDVTVSPTHRILLSSNYRPTKPWESALLLHEFDHVAISTDPRLFAMLHSLDGRRSVLIGTPPDDSQSYDEWARSKIGESAKAFQQKVEMLVNDYYVRLDEASSHGLRTISDRTKFFTQLYSIEDLESSKFTYLKEVREHIEQVNSNLIKQHYRIP